MKKIFALGVLLLVSGLLQASLLPGIPTDTVEPAWRGQANTTLQAWNFDSASNPALVTVDQNPYGTPSATVFEPDTTIPKKTYWMPSDNDHTGVWRIYGWNYMELYLPNSPQENPIKEIWLQITYSAGSIDRKPEIQTQPEYATMQVMQSTVVDALYYHDVIKITLNPNPTEEWIYLLPRDCTLYIDEIVVDTICIPEPMTIAILGLGGLLLRKRKK